MESFVEYYAEHEKYKCGYCKKLDTNFSHGMMAYYLSVTDYKDLMDRGWRRSGKYCYKPTMDITCCPTYTIRCDALNFKLTKSQKKVIKKFNRFLSGEDHNNDNDREHKMTTSDNEENYDMGNDCFVETKRKQKKLDINNIKYEDKSSHQVTKHDNKEGVPVNSSSSSKEDVKINDISTAKEKSISKPGSGPNPDKGACKKAKLLRLERKMEKLKAKGADPMSIFQKEPKNREKSLEDFLDDIPEAAKNRLEIRLVRTAPPSAEWKASATESYGVYLKYQTGIHDDKEDSCSQSQYKKFLICSPLQEDYGSGSPPCGYGSFQQQYWLDGKIVAVGVIDILPQCTSSVYFYYDPQYSHLSFGTYGALREIALTRQLNIVSPSIRYYYMGFYIHSCVKMRYKGNYKPSFLLCPETYKWFPIEKCIGKLDESPYTRINDNIDALDEDSCTERDLEHVRVIYHDRVMPYLFYISRYVSGDRSEKEELQQYSKLVGRKLAKRLILMK